MSRRAAGAAAGDKCVAQNPLPIWIFFIGLLVMLRRDRRWLARWPQLGLGVFAGLLAGYAVWRWVARPGPLNEEDGVALRGVLALCSGFAVPLVWVWSRALVTHDLTRLWRHLRGTVLWTTVCVLVSILAAGIYFWFGTRLAACGVFHGIDTLFGADPATYQDVLATKIGAHKHPLLASVWHVCFHVAALFVSAERAPLAISSAAGGISVGLAAAYFRRVTGSAGLGCLAALALGATAAHLVFGALPESYAVSTATLVLLNVVVACAAVPPVRFRHQVLATVVAAGATSTNVGAALACFAARHPGQRRPRSLLRWLACSVVLGGVLVTAQNALLPQAAVAFQPGWFVHDVGFTAAGPSAEQRASNLVGGLLVQNIVGAPPAIVDTNAGPVLQPGPYAGGMARLTIIVWGVVLLAGAYGLIRARPWHRPTFLAALGSLACAAVLHTFYGNDNLFLYSCSFTFYVLALLAHALPARRPKTALIVVSSVLVLLIINNALFAAEILVSLARLGPAAVH